MCLKIKILLKNLTKKLKQFRKHLMKFIKVCNSLSQFKYTVF